MPGGAPLLSCSFLALFVPTGLCGADGPPAIPKREYDDKTDYAKLSLDGLIEGLDAGRWPGSNHDALAEILRRGPDALRQATPVVRDWRYASSNTSRMLALLLVNRDALDRPAALVPAFRAAAKPGPVYLGGPSAGNDLNDQPLPRAADEYLSPGLAKALRSDQPEDVAAAVEIARELRFYCLPSLYPVVAELAKGAKGDRRKPFLELLAQTPGGSVPAYVGFVQGGDDELRELALKQLAAIEPFFYTPKNPSAVKALRELYSHKDEPTRLVALQAGFLMGDTETALPELLKHPWPRQPGPKEGETSPWPALPKNVQKRFDQPSPENMKPMAAAIKEAVLGEGVQRQNGLYALLLTRERGVDVWRELKDAKDLLIRTAANEIVAEVDRQPKRLDFRDLPPDEQRKRIKDSLGSDASSFDEPSLDRLPRELVESVLPDVEESFLKAGDSRAGYGKCVRLLFRAGPKGEAVLQKALAAGGAQAEAIVHAWQPRTPEAHPTLAPALAKCLPSKSFRVRVLAAEILAAGKSPPAEVAAVLKEAYALCDKPAELLKATGEPADDEVEAREVAEEFRLRLASRLVLADWPARKEYLGALTDRLGRDSLEKGSKHQAGFRRAAEYLWELGPAAKDASPALVKLMEVCKDPAAKAAVSRLLRSADVEAARRAGVR